MRKITAIIMFISVLILGGWDLYAYVVGGSRATISVIITDISKDFLIIPVMFGVLIGHWFWQNDCQVCKAREEEK